MTILSTELIVSVLDRGNIHYSYNVHYMYINVRYSEVKLEYSTVPQNFGLKYDSCCKT